MSFQFPANPANGDIIIQPQPDGRYIKGTYNELTDTWAVGELPEEPGVPGPEGPKGDQGDKGNPGKGVAVSGVVATESALPTPNDATLQFWIVDDTNTLFYSDGFEWTNLGSPVTGPQGIPGQDGTNGTNGTDGVPGLGWTGTTIIDETDQNPPNYQINFNSNDGLGFVTDNLVGPQGEVGNIPLASATRLGGIKIGRGLNIQPDGTASAGETNVDLETVPLTPEGTIYAPTTFNLNFSPVLGTLPNSMTNSLQSQTGTAGGTVSGTIQMAVPELSDGCIVYYFVGSDCSIYLQSGWTTAKLFPGYLHLVSNLSVTGASFADGFGLSIPMKHNVAGQVNQPYWQSTLPSMKVGQIVYPQGTNSVTFNQSVTCQRAKSCYYTYGRCRIVLQPFKSTNAPNPLTSTVDGISWATNPLTSVYGDPDYDGSKDFYDPNPPVITPAQITQMNNADFKDEVNSMLELIDVLTKQQYSSGPDYDNLMTQRQALIDMRTLPGSFDQLYNDVFTPIATVVNGYNAYDYRFLEE